METKKPITQISVLSFTCALLFYTFIHDKVLLSLTTDPTWLKVFVEILSAIGFYSIIFEAFFQLYSRHFYKIFNRRLNMEGEWYQIFIINEYEDTFKAIRHGPCKIISTFESVTLSGENYHLDNTFSSSWQSETSVIIANKLTLMFISEGKRRQNSITRGTMSFSIHGSPPTQLVGCFSDSTPATHSGHITLFKQKSDYEARLNSLNKREGEEHEKKDVDDCDEKSEEN